MDVIKKEEASFQEIYSFLDEVKKNKELGREDHNNFIYKSTCKFKSFIKFFKRIKNENYIDENLRWYIKLYDKIFEEIADHKNISLTGFKPAIFQERAHDEPESLFGIYKCEAVWSEEDSFKYSRIPRVSKIKISKGDSSGNCRIAIYTQDNTDCKISKRDLYEFKFYETEILFNHYHENRKINMFKDKNTEEIKYYDNSNDLTSMDDGANLVLSNAISYTKSDAKNLTEEEYFL